MELNIEGNDRVSGESKNIFKVVGIGGGGNNTIRQMVSMGIDADFLAINTDLQVLDSLPVPASCKLMIGKTGMGAGGDPQKGREAADECRLQIQEAIAGAKMLFLATGMGGGTGTGATPIVAQIAKEMGILTVAVVTTPFSWECAFRKKYADEGIEALKKEIDSIIIIPNDRITEFVTDETIYMDLFKAIDEVLANAVRCILNIIQKVGYMNIDFQDVHNALEKGGETLIGVGVAEGEDRITAAVNAAIHSPLLGDFDLRYAKKVLLSVTIPKSIPAVEVTNLFSQIHQILDEEKTHFWPGLFVDNTMGNKVEVVVIASDLDKNSTERVDAPAEGTPPLRSDPNHVSANEMAFFTNTFRSDYFRGERPQEELPLDDFMKQNTRRPKGR